MGAKGRVQSGPAAAIALAVALARCAGGGATPPVVVPPPVDTTPLATRTIQLLERVVRVDSGGGDEAAVARQIAAFLDTAGIPSRIVPWRPGRSSLVARIGPERGRPIVLASHLDAPPADPRRWPREAGPFTASRRGDHLVGRGVLSGKGLAVAHAHVLSDLARREADLVRPVVMVAVAGGLEPDHGATLAVLDAHPEIARAALVLTIGGVTLVEPDFEDRLLHWMPIAEPGWAYIEVTAVGDASDPASVRLARHLPRLLREASRDRLPAATREGMRALADTASPLSTLAYRWAPLTELLVVPRWAEAPFLEGLVRESVQLVELEGGRGTAPEARARARLRCRLLPGTRPETVRRRLRQVARDPRLFFTIRATTAPIASPRPDPEIVAQLTAASQRDGWEQGAALGLAVHPSPAAAFRSQAAAVVGFWPLPLTPEELARVDQPEEAVSVPLYLDAASRLRDVVLELSREAPRTPIPAP